MRIKANNPEEYIAQLADDRKEAINGLRKVVLDNLPPNFEECMNYGMLGYVVPHSVYPPGYHCNTELPLPFMNLANQKNFIGVYHLGIYAIPELYDWFVEEYGKRVKTKLDMGKSCIRLKKMDQIPFDLFGELASKLTAQQWIDVYEAKLKR